MIRYRAHIDRTDRIVKFDADGNYVTRWGDYGSGEGKFTFQDDPPYWNNGTAFHREHLVYRDGRVYCIHYDTLLSYGRIQCFTDSGTFVWEANRAYNWAGATPFTDEALLPAPHTQSISMGVLSPKRKVQVYGNVATVTGDVTVTGTISGAVPSVQSETIALNGTTIVSGTKEWTTLTAVSFPAYTVAGETVTVTMGEQHGFSTVRDYAVSDLGLTVLIGIPTGWVGQVANRTWDGMLVTYDWATGEQVAASLLISPTDIGSSYRRIGSIMASKQTTGATAIYTAGRDNGNCFGWTIYGGLIWGLSIPAGTVFAGGWITEITRADENAPSSFPKTVYSCYGYENATLADPGFVQIRANNDGYWAFGGSGGAYYPALKHGQQCLSLNDALGAVLVVHDESCSITMVETVPPSFPPSYVPCIVNHAIYDAPVPSAGCWTPPDDYPDPTTSMGALYQYHSPTALSAPPVLLSRAWMHYGMAYDDPTGVYTVCDGCIDDDGNVYIADLNYTVTWEEVYYPDPVTGYPGQISTKFDLLEPIQHCVYMRDNVILYTRAGLSGGFSAGVVIGDGNSPSLVCLPDGRLHVVYQDVDTGDYIFRQSRDRGLTWEVA